jgi:mRNA interferase MazF
MAIPSIGAVVLVPFPFSDLSNSKLRPAVVLADADRGDFVLCQITSKSYSDPLAVELINADFYKGSLRFTSYARPAKIFTANHTLFQSQVGELTRDALKKIVDAIIELLNEGLN